LKGVPLRLEIGPRDIEKGAASYMRRDTFEKGTLELDSLVPGIKALLDEIRRGMLHVADAFRISRTLDVFSMEEMGEQVNTGYARAMWCGERACEDKIKEAFSATSRNMPFDQPPIADTCVCCGKQAKHLTYFAKAY
jgi:prolyl-tRNA synthetase